MKRIGVGTVTLSEQAKKMSWKFWKQDVSRTVLFLKN